MVVIIYVLHSSNIVSWSRTLRCNICEMLDLFCYNLFKDIARGQGNMRDIVKL